MKKNKSINQHLSKSGMQGMLLMLAMLLMSLLPERAAAQLDLSRLMTIDDGITVTDISTGRYKWTESDKEGCMPGIMAEDQLNNVDEPSGTLTMQVTSDKDFQFSFDYQFDASSYRGLSVSVDGTEVMCEMANGTSSFSLPIVAGTHKVNIFYGRSGDDGIVRRAYLYNMKVSATIDTPTEKRAVAVYSKANKTFTFYYDTKVRPFGGDAVYEVLQTDRYVYPSWNSEDWRRDVETVVFDKSFKDYLPKSLYSWFGYFTKLTNVIGIENLNTSETVYFEKTFEVCHALKSLDLSSWNTGKAESFDMMFYGCESLEDLCIDGFNTASATRLGPMFAYCYCLKELDLTSFNTANVEYMNRMFAECSSLNTIYVSDAFKTDKVSSSDAMFFGCTSLKGAMAYNPNCTDAAYANYETGYLTKGCLHKDDAGNSTWGNPVAVKATCIEGASTLYTCSLCLRTKKEYTGDPDPTAHAVMKHEATEPTCGKEGNKLYYECELCHKMWLDEALQNEIADITSLQIKRTGHVLDDNGDCSECHLHVMTLNGVKAEFHYIADTQWDILNDENGEHGLVYNNENGDRKVNILAMTLTSDKDFELSFSSISSAISYVADGKSYDMYSRPKPFKLKAGTRKFIVMTYDSARLWDIKASVTESAGQPVEGSCGKMALDMRTGVATIYSNDKAPEASEYVRVSSLPVLSDLSEGRWFEYSELVKKVVVDESFKSVKPENTVAWFAGFYNCREFAGLENLDVSETTAAQYMFYFCPVVTTLDLSTFNTAKMKDMTSMFARCYQLTTIYATDLFSTASVEAGEGMFDECHSLKGAIYYDRDKTTYEYANYENGYFTKGCLHKDANGNSTLVKKEDVAADCMTVAHSVYECSLCQRTVEGDFNGEPDPAKHKLSLITAPAEPTCTKAGNSSVYRCEVCKKYFDSEDATRQVFTEEDVAISPLGHDLDEKYECRRCHTVDLRYSVLSLDGVKANILDNDYPWQLVDQSDAPKLMSNNREVRDSDSDMEISLVSDKAFRVDFGYKVSSGRNCDELTISSDFHGEIAEVSGEQEGSKTLYFPAGAHSLKFSYSKNGSTDEGDDAAWLTSFRATTQLTADDMENSLKAAVIYNADDNSFTWKAFDLNTVLQPSETTYFIDLDDETANGMPKWCEHYGVRSVRIDKSFSQFRPKSILGWFAGTSADHIDGLQYLNTSETLYFASAFYNSFVASLDLSTLDTSKGIDFAGMFAICTGLNELDLTSFDMSNAQYIDGMFYNCVSLDKIYVSKHFGVSDILTDFSKEMFSGCVFLSGAKKYDASFTNATEANYRDGYLSTYYKVGDKRFDLSGDMTVDELLLEDGKPFMTHDAFTAKNATLQRTLSADNTYNIGTVCLPYALTAANGYTLYAVKNVAADEPAKAKKTAAADATYATLYLEKISGELPAGTPAIFKAEKSTVEFAAADAAVVEQPVDDETLASNGFMLRGAFTEYAIEPESYVYADNEFVRASSLSADGAAITGSPLTACLTALPGYGVAADRLYMESDDNVISAVRFVESLSDGSAEIFDLNGVKLNGLKQGVNIIRHAGGKTQKVVVR